MCRVYGYRPSEVLSMPYRHVIMLAGHIDRNERRLACYAAFAFNSPKDLMADDNDTETVCTDFDADELLSACNDV